MSGYLDFFNAGVASQQYLIEGWQRLYEQAKRNWDLNSKKVDELWAENMDFRSKIRKLEAQIEQLKNEKQ